jgi:hypothetical protein
MSDPYFYHLFKFEGQQISRDCEPPNQCILQAGIPGEIDPYHVVFKYRKHVDTERLKTLLKKELGEDKGTKVVNDLCTTPDRENNPYGYLKLNLDTGLRGFFQAPYLIVKTKSDEIPNLFNLIDRVPYNTPTPQFFKKVGGSRRRTRSQKKRRRATRRRN